MTNPTPDLGEAKRLHDLGFKLCKLKPTSKQPEGLEWQRHPVASIDDNATGYGLMLSLNKLCSIDPDNFEAAKRAMSALGFDLEAIMATGVRTTSTRPGSGGRAAFKATEGLGWVKFAFKGIGTVLELRATSPNLQDAIPGVVYAAKDTDELFTQTYTDGKRLDATGDLPPDFREWWHRMSNDLSFLREQQAKAAEALGVKSQLAVSNSTGKELAFKSPHRQFYNEHHDVESILIAHGYAGSEGRFSPPTATGAAGVRPIPGKNDLWQSDHASDPLHGTFDAWTANVVLNYEGDLAAAEDASAAEMQTSALDDFRDLTDTSTTTQASGNEATPPTDHRFKLLNGTMLASLPPLRWLVHGVLPAEGCAALYGPSASGKTFIGLDMATAVAEGRRWYGHRVNARPVVYVALEGEAGFKTRAAAWEVHHARPLPARLYLVLQPFALVKAEDVKDLASAILATGGAGALVIVDTLNRAAPTADENASKDMGLILEATKALQRLVGGVVMLVHHTGKDTTKGLRGHSSMFAALDAAIEVRRIGEARDWSLAKAKDGQDGITHPFRLEVINVGTDSDGEAITSCVAVGADRGARPAKPLTPNQQVGWDTFNRAQNNTQAGVHVEKWRAEFYRASTADSVEAKKKAFQRARNELLELGRLTVSDDIYQTAGGGSDDFL